MEPFLYWHVDVYLIAHTKKKKKKKNSYSLAATFLLSTCVNYLHSCVGTAHNKLSAALLPKTTLQPAQSRPSPVWHIISNRLAVQTSCSTAQPQTLFFLCSSPRLTVMGTVFEFFLWCWSVGCWPTDRSLKMPCSRGRQSTENHL